MEYEIDMITMGNRYVYQIREEDIIQEFDTYREAEEYLAYLKPLLLPILLVQVFFHYLQFDLLHEVLFVIVCLQISYS